MIAKRILRPKAASNFGRLGAYILDDGRAPSETLATHTFSYILDGEEDAGRVGAVRVSNCMSEAPDLAIKEILATQALNKRSRSDRTYHLVVSFEPGETPTPGAHIASWRLSAWRPGRCGRQGRLWPCAAAPSQHLDALCGLCPPAPARPRSPAKIPRGQRRSPERGLRGIRKRLGRYQALGAYPGGQDIETG
ncbi:relaxase/mobilization nuclease domain-containing protein [Rhodomicrobium vannielii]|uniref:relaxase/mobilization nuclease domain-containing protein n=1 Tax=Rhodomicrobium vannielii TaxID=1069 RepID=UPI0001C25194